MSNSSDRFICNIGDLRLLDENGNAYEDTEAELQRRIRITEKLRLKDWTDTKRYRCQHAQIHAAVSPVLDTRWQLDVDDGLVKLFQGPRDALTYLGQRPLTEAQLSELESTLIDLGVDRWEREYSDPDLDELQWEMSVETTEIKVRSSGSSAYPENFDDVMAAIKALFWLSHPAKGANART